MFSNFYFITIALATLQMVQCKNFTTVRVGDYGFVKGFEHPTIGNMGAPPKMYYTFRNLKYGYVEKRYQQPKMFNGEYGNASHPFDASMTGPLCPQGGVTQGLFDSLDKSTINDIVDTVLAGLPSLPGIDTDLVIDILEALFEVAMDGKTLAEIIHDWLDVDLSVKEDCLHLAVSTPGLPKFREKNATYPVMVFVHGGGFTGGTQIKMEADRLGDVADVVVVGINYRLGTLGFMCLPSDEAAGNMGMLDIVIALDWIQDNIAYFGGDPSRVTIFGESAGSATMGHLMLSPTTKGKFSYAIGQSGSAVSPWAFDMEPEFHSREIARNAGCTNDDVTELIECLRILPVETILQAASDYQQLNRDTGASLGFGGLIPCAQSHGKKKFYEIGTKPIDILESGNYTKVPIMFGANKNEGSFVFSVVYDSFYTFNNLTYDAEFLTNGFVEQMLSTIDVDQGYAFADLLTEKYFDEWQLGNMQDMVPGAVDILGVFFLKASSYKLVQENAEYEHSFWYSLDYESKKSLFHVLNIGGLDGIDLDPGVCHGDELMYIFNLDLPLVLCEITETLSHFIGRLLECMKIPGGIDIDCLTDKESNFMKNYGQCLKGGLTEEEQKVSDTILKAWTNFAINGDPNIVSNNGQKLEPWSKKNPNYVSFKSEPEIELDYTKTFNTALDESRNKTSTTMVPTTTATTMTTATTTTTSTTSDGISLKSSIVFSTLSTLFIIL